MTKRPNKCDNYNNNIENIESVFSGDGKFAIFSVIIGSGRSSSLLKRRALIKTPFLMMQKNIRSFYSLGEKMSGFRVHFFA